MKKAILLAVLLVIFAKGFSQKQALDSLFAKANDAYIQENYYKAVEWYDSIYTQGFESYDLLYNLGNSYYKLNEFAKAILFYERAKLLNPKNENVAYNLELANMHVVDKIDVLPEFFLRKWRKSLQTYFSANAWAKINLISVFLLFVSFIVYFFNRYGLVGKFAFALTILLFITSLLSFNFGSKQKKNILKHNYAIVMSHSVTIKSSPDNNGTSLFVLHQGTKVNITDQIGDWYEIKLSDGNKGWILKTDLERI